VGHAGTAPARIESEEPLAPRASAVHELKTLVLSYHPVIAIETLEEQRVEEVLRLVAERLRMPLFEWSVAHGLGQADGRTLVPNTNDPGTLLRHLVEIKVPGIFLLRDFSRHLDQATVARQFRELAQRFGEQRSSLVLTGDPIDLPREIAHRAVFLPFAPPGPAELGAVVRAVVKSLGPSSRPDLDLGSDEREALIRALQGMTLNQARQAVAYAILEDGVLSAADIGRITARKARMIEDGGLLEYFPEQDNRHQIGGFARLIAFVERAQVGFSDAARALNLDPPRGILIVGVQGCGKSLAAKVVARTWRLPLLKLDAGRLYDKYVGETERNFRRAVALAESMAPAVLWIDEIEKGLAPGGSDSADGGVSRRIFGSFLTWMQEKSRPVFVVATANDLSLLPSEMLRKGRFDEIFFVDLPSAEERRAILEIHLGLRRQDPAAFDLAEVVSLTDGFSGAELEQVVVGALYRALHERVSPTAALLLDEARATVPLSVSRAEALAELREAARGRFVPVA
jgi:hypothetical protein